MRQAIRQTINHRAITLWTLLYLIVGMEVITADLNILIVGNTNSFSDTNESGVVQEKAFNPTNIATELTQILSNDPDITEPVNVVFDNIFKTKALNVRYSKYSNENFINHCYSLAQHFMWPDGKGERRANLRGENGTQWDYVILMADPYILANFPGMYTEGVKMMTDEIKKGSAEPILFAQWPESTSSFSANDFNEIAFRVSQYSNLKVVPAGKAWDTLTSQDSSTNHPTPHGAYLGAASIYSTIFSKSASTSAYAFNHSIANHAHSIVTTNEGVPQFTGDFTDITTYQMKYDTKRTINFKETGTSTENGIAGAIARLRDRFIVEFVRNNDALTYWDFNYGRGNDWWEDSKDYEVDPSKYGRSYGFPFHHYGVGTANSTMPYGIDKQYHDNGVSTPYYEDGTDLGIAYNMVRPYPHTRELSLPHDVRAIPIRLLWLKMKEIYPDLYPLHDPGHMNRYLDDASASFMLTLQTGRNPMSDEPTEFGSSAWLTWLGQKIGYETAWQMSHLTTRAPGFQALAERFNYRTVSLGGSARLNVRSLLEPTDPISVNISVSDPTVAIVSPKSITINPDSFDTIQNVRVLGLPGTTTSEAFNVIFSTQSNDKINDGLNIEWEYTNHRPANTVTNRVSLEDQTIQTDSNSSIAIPPLVTGYTYNNTKFAAPFSGNINWDNGQPIYTPHPGFSGIDHYAYVVHIGETVTTGHVTIQVSDIPLIVIDDSNGSTTISEDGLTDFYTVVLNRQPNADVTVNLSPDSEVNVSKTSLNFTTTNWNLPQSVTVAAIDDTQVEADHFGVIEHVTVSSDSEWNGVLSNISINIVDNDNNAPDVNAGTDQSLTLSGGFSWSPAEINTTLWVDASDSETLIMDGSNLTEWRDKSGGENHLVQNNTSQQPLISNNLSNGLEGIDFTGDKMVTASNPFGSSIEDAFVIVVHRIDAINNGVLFSLTGSEAGANRWNAHAPWGNGTAYFDCGGTGGTNRINSSLGVTSNQVVITSYYCSTTENTQKMFLNGSVLVEDTTGHSISTVQGISIGGVNNLQDTTIGELIVINGTVSQDTREKLEGYLAQKWGLASELPEEHPYSTAPIHSSSVIANLTGMASDSDGDILSTSWSLVSGPSTVSFGDSSSLTTTATLNATGTYTLRLSADDGTDISSDDLVITVSEPSSNTLPVANNQTALLNEDESMEIILSASDADGDSLTYTISTQPTSGTLSGSAPNLIYSPDLNFNGTDSFTFKANDGTGDSNTATMTISITPVNDAPNVDAGTDQNLVPDTAGLWTPAELNSAIAWYDASDLESIEHTDNQVTKWIDKIGSADLLASSGNPETGTRTSATGLNVLDFQGDRLVSSQGVNTTSGNAAVFLVMDYDSKGNGTSTAVALISSDNNYLLHYPAAEGKPRLSFSQYSIGTGVRTYTNAPNGPFLNNAIFSTSADTTGGKVRMDIRVNGQNHSFASLTTTAVSSYTDLVVGARLGATQPVNGGYAELIIVEDISPETRQKIEGYLAHKWGLQSQLPTDHPYLLDPPGGNSLGVTADLIGTASDIDGDSLTTSWYQISGPATSSIASPEQLQTTVTFIEQGTYVLGLSANDGLAQVSDEVTISVTDGGINTAPIAFNDFFSTDQNTSVMIDLNATDGESDPLNYTIVQAPLNGTLSGTGSQRTYIPNLGFSGLDSFLFLVDDGVLASTPAQVDITVDPIIPDPSDSPLIYEPFNQIAGNILTGQKASNIGLLGNFFWKGGSHQYDVMEGSLNYGNLATSGNSIQANVRHENFYVDIDSSLEDSGLLDHGSELWFSVLHNIAATESDRADWAFALSSNPLIYRAWAPHYVQNTTPGIGFSIRGSQNLTSSVWTQGVQDPNESVPHDITPNGNEYNTTIMIVGKITWGVDSSSEDTIEIYLPDTEMNLGNSVAVSFDVIDQSLLDTLTICGARYNHATAPLEIDEIKFGPSFSSVSTSPVPEP